MEDLRSGKNQKKKNYTDQQTILSRDDEVKRSIPFQIGNLLLLRFLLRLRKTVALINNGNHKSPPGTCMEKY